MALQPVRGTPGLWRSGSQGALGVHALIIGVSDYPYLSGGSAPDNARAPDNGGLGQLEVSALSGAMFFNWLIGADGVGGAPIASCRLHLAPRPAELDRVNKLGQGNYGPADYATLRTALDGWSDEMTIAGQAGVAPNVALFFFSGHGVEVAASPAVLASDVLNQLTAGQGANKAIAIDAMTTAIKTYNIDRGLFFVDACRDAPMAARLINLIGDQSLLPSRMPIRRPDALIRLQSTASGLKSYQVKDETGTLFTQAVLDGLQGPPPNFIPYDTTNLPWALKFGALEGHVKRMVSALLADHSPLAVQSVEPYGNPYNGDMIVAQKSGPLLGGGDEPPPAVPEIPDLKSTVAFSAANVLKRAISFDAGVVSNIRAQSAAFEPQGDLFNSQIMHSALGHETATGSWLNALQFLDARTGAPTDPTVARVFASHRQEIDGRIAAWVDVLVQPGEGEAVWIGYRAMPPSPGGGQTVAGAAVTIPRDTNYPIPVRIDVQLESIGSHNWKLRQMSARLADPNAASEYLPDGWTILFKAQQTETFADLASAARPLVEQFDGLQQVLAAKRQSPVAAAMATNLLLRANGLAYLRDWPRNLTNWFEWLADAPVLWAETLLRRRQAAEVKLEDPIAYEAFETFLKLAERGVPMLAPTLTLAIHQASLWRTFLESPATLEADRVRLKGALAFIDRAAPYAVSGIGFAGFVSGDPMMRPQSVLGISAELQGTVA